MSRHVQVAVEAPISQALTYSLPEELSHLSRGHSIVVPLGKRQAAGLILGPSTEKTEHEIKSIHAADEDRPALPEAMIQWVQWLSSYYQYPLGQTISSCFPPLPRTSKGKTRKGDVVPAAGPQKDLKLSSEQKSAVNHILKTSDFNVHLLYGVTGSGKTEVYMESFAAKIAQGEPCLLLVPEISLTPQLINRFASRFPDQVAVIHSHLTDRERTNQWWDVVSGKKKILIGARSALFCPVERWGLIAIDEEHEASYKQEEKLKYHARDAAIMLAKLQNTSVVLGSATPSLETWAHAINKKYSLLHLKTRVQNRPMPEMIVVDLKEKTESNLPFWMSPRLYEELNDTLLRGEQAALFLNRRGMAHMVLCESCGYVEECENCSIGLTLHAKKHLVCHYCGYEKLLKDMCPDCKTGELKTLGLGTELVEHDLMKLFPEIKIARADRDEIRSREDLENLVRSVENKEVQVLIGTQMIAKGLDFPGLNLVGVLLADIGMNIPDFRASERTYQLITQVAGRSGRHSDRPGKTIIQTYNPEHAGLIAAVNGHFEPFAEQELKVREELKYPPYGRLLMIRVQGSKPAELENLIRKLKRHGGELLKAGTYQGVQLLGPTSAPISKLKGQYRYHILLKAASANTLRAFYQQLKKSIDPLPSSIKVQADIDPVSLL